MSKILELQAMSYTPAAEEGNSNKSRTCQGNSCISLFCGGGGGEEPAPSDEISA